MKDEWEAQQEHATYRHLHGSVSVAWSSLVLWLLHCQEEKESPFLESDWGASSASDKQNENLPCYQTKHPKILHTRLFSPFVLFTLLHLQAFSPCLKKILPSLNPTHWSWERGKSLTETNISLCCGIIDHRSGRFDVHVFCVFPLPTNQCPQNCF